MSKQGYDGLQHASLFFLWQLGTCLDPQMAYLRVASALTPACTGGDSAARAVSTSSCTVHLRRSDKQSQSLGTDKDTCCATSNATRTVPLSPAGRQHRARAPIRVDGLRARIWRRGISSRSCLALANAHLCDARSCFHLSYTLKRRHRAAPSSGLAYPDGSPPSKRGMALCTIWFVGGSAPGFAASVRWSQTLCDTTPDQCSLYEGLSPLARMNPLSSALFTISL
ncbi:hypothetical protein F5Y18DRAFT_19167 [Xylariaceae sp. FL1019]|nr:hypothetical protein F5Y18DRAFT_19167 [Xylariaceae sp. FL1019]